MHRAEDSSPNGLDLMAGGNVQLAETTLAGWGCRPGQVARFGVIGDTLKCLNP